MVRRNRGWIVVWLLLSACSTTKNLPEGEVLYTGIKKYEIVSKEKTQEGQKALDEVESALSYAPNYSLLGSSSLRFPIPFGLWVYNALVNKKGKFNQWIFDKFGVKPVLISTVNPEMRVNVAYNTLHNYGYFNAFVAYREELDRKNPRKAKLSYKISTGEAYKIDSIDYSRLSPQLYTLVQQHSEKSLLHTGDPFNVAKMESERQRITELLRNNGYYYYRANFLSYQGDSTIVSGRIALRINPAGTIPAVALHPWRWGNSSVWLNGYDNEPPTDSIRYKDLMIHYQGKLRIRPSVLYRQLRFKQGELYSQKQQEQTLTSLSRLGIFRYTEMQFSPGDTTANQNRLNLRINAGYDLPLDGELEVNVTAKSNNNVGPGVVFGVTKRNLFGGGETFNVKLRGSYEWQTGKRVVGPSAAINSYELSATTKLTVPGALIPSLRWKLDGKYPANTSFQLYASLMNRARFFRLLAFGGDASLEFQTSQVSRHTFTPFKLSFNLLQHTTAEFDSIVKTNPALYKSLEDQFIPAISYSYTYDDSQEKTAGNFLWWQLSVTEAGLLTNSIYTLAGGGFNTPGKNLLGNPFAQFIKGSAEIRYNYDLGRKHRLVARAMVGAVYSYGNATTTPYNEQFYIGGANSIRAFTVRSIGPGRYNPDPNNAYAYIDQTGDLKFEANLEYRFPIIGGLHGAAFLDCGNIWLLRNDPLRQGGQFRISDFLNDLALGTGAGIRYVLPFLVIRFDVGIGLHVPFNTGVKGYYNIPSFGDGLGFHLAVGYPF